MGPSGPSVGGVASAGQFGALPAVAPGSWIEIYGGNLATNVRSWTGSDFTNGGLTAPTALDGNSVTIGGQPAYHRLHQRRTDQRAGPLQRGTGQQPLVVTNANGGKATFTVTVNAVEPGLYAPSSFVIGGKQYAGAVANDGVTFILPPGAISGITSQRANPGDRITFYGVGFGPVTPAISAGQVVTAQNTLPRFRCRSAARLLPSVRRPGARRYRALSIQRIRAHQRGGQRPDAGDLHGERHKRHADAIYRGAVIAWPAATRSRRQ